MLNNENYGYLIHPLFQFMDANLKPLTSAYLKVFYAGTSSSAYTYSDWEGTLNVSDIMLSMNGSANVIAEKNKAYKVMLCDALHPPSNPIWVKDNLYVISSVISSEIEVIDNTAIKDNAYDSVTNPASPDNITAIEQLTFFRNVGDDSKYTTVESEERVYGVLLPHPSREADIGKVPMLNNLGQIVWDFVPDEDFIDERISFAVQNLPTQDSGVTTTVSEITEDTNVTLVAGQNRYLNCTNSPTISVEIADNNIYHLQINGSCTINLTGVSWGGDAITAITTKAEISILNNIAVGVLYE